MDIKFIYNFVFKLIFELIKSKELKTYYDVFFYEPIDSIQKKKKSKQAHLTKAKQQGSTEAAFLLRLTTFLLLQLCLLMYILLWALGPLGPITLLVQHTYTCTALYLYRTLMPPI